MGHFWQGFEKRAISLTGMKAGLRSGKRNYSSLGNLARSQPKSGIVEAPRAVSPPLPTPTSSAPKGSLIPKPSSKAPSVGGVPKPPKMAEMGASSTNI